MPSFTIPEDDYKLLFANLRKQPVERAVFRLARYLRCNQGFLIDAEKPMVADAMAQWIERAAKIYRPEVLDPEDIHEQLKVYWTKVAYPLGIHPVADAVKKARDNPEFPLAPFDYGQTHALVFRACYWLNVAATKAAQPSWFVSSHELAKHVGHRQTVVYRALKRMEREGRLTVAEPGTTQKATRYNTILPSLFQ